MYSGPGGCATKRTTRDFVIEQRDRLNGPILPSIHATVLQPNYAN